MNSNSYEGDEMVSIPHPYTGLTARLGRREINVHMVNDGIVYYGTYDDDADDVPYRCVGLNQRPVQEFIDRLGRSILDGAVTFSLIDCHREDRHKCIST